MAKNRRSLTDEEAALWESVARSAKPLRPPRKTVAAQIADKPPAPVRAPVPKTAFVPPTLRAKVHYPSPGLGRIDRRASRRIARGSIAIDARLDLHGLTQAEAHSRLIRFLERARDEGGRLVLVITGKGTYDHGDRGVLRRALPHWLEHPPLRGLVSGFDQAHRSHGGAGAYYIRLKRTRPDL